MTKPGFDEKYIFRLIEPKEWEQAANLEIACFPPNEACKPEMMHRRVLNSPDMFLMAIERETGIFAGMIDGAATDREKLTDDFFTDEKTHDPEGCNCMILGVMTRPEFQRQGLAGEMMRRYASLQRRSGKKKMILTCLEGKIAMYASFGFEDLGWSESQWGGECWHEMEMTL